MEARYAFRKTNCWRNVRSPGLFEQVIPACTLYGALVHHLPWSSR